MYAQWQHVNGPFGGSVNGLIIKDQNIFASTKQQGVFISSNNGSSWAARSNGLTTSYAICITMKGSRIFLGTGSGLFVSADNGATWNTVLINGVANSLINAVGSNAQSIFIITNYTLYRSDDEGATWITLFYQEYLYSMGINGNTVFWGSGSSVLYRSVNNGMDYSSIDLSNYYNFYCPVSYAFTGSAIFASGVTGLVFKSTDNGDTWTEVTNGMSNPAAITLTASGNKIYAGCYVGQLYYPTSPGDGGIYVSQDEGAHWTSLGMKGYTVETIAISGNRIIAGTLQAGIFISDDGGLTWNSSNNGLVRLPVSTIAQNGSDLFVSCKLDYDYGMNNLLCTMRSPDHGMSWVIADSGMTYPLANIIVSGGSYVLAGGYDVCISRNNGHTWHSVFNPGYTINALVISGSHIFTGTNGGGIFLSDDEGVNWHSVNNGLENSTVLSMIIKGNALFAGTASGVFRSVDNGSSWVPATNGIDGVYIIAMAANNNFLFASGYYSTPGLFRSADNGDSWTRMPFVFSYNISATSLAASNDKIIAGTSDGSAEVLYSGDNGDNWSVVSTGLPGGFMVPAVFIQDSIVYAGLVDNYPYNGIGAGLWQRPLSDFVPFILTGDTVIMQETAGDLKTLGITSETPWNIDGTLPAWLVVDKNSGTGSDVLTFTTTQANPDQQARYTSMDVVSMGVSRHVTVVQKQKLNGINDQLIQTVSIFPNPTSGSIVIESTARFDKLSIYSAPGQILSEQPVVSTKTQIDLSRYGRGVYYIRLSSEKGNCIRQVVVL